MWRALLPLALGGALPPAELAARYERAATYLDHVSAELREAVVDGDYHELVLLTELVAQAGEGLRGTDKAGQGYAAQIAQLALRVPDSARLGQNEALLLKLPPELMRVGKVPLAPAVRPDLARGEALYGRACAVCHGTREQPMVDLALSLEPPPSSFFAPDVMGALSPLRAYGVITHGLPSTSMPSFEVLSAQERWDLAFYVFAQRQLPCAAPAPVLSLEALARATDAELVERYGEAKLGCFRTALR